MRCWSWGAGRRWPPDREDSKENQEGAQVSGAFPVPGAVQSILCAL